MPHNVNMLNEQIALCLEEWEKIMPRPLHAEMVEEWKNDMKNCLAKLNNEDDTELVESITIGIMEAYELWISEITGITKFSDPVEHKNIIDLMQRPQTAQRSSDWYTEFKSRLTASEIFKLFGSPRERAILVMQKSGKQEMPQRSNTLATTREKMGPLDWGICFEPVVKQIIEHEWGAVIHDCGRFVHPIDEYLAASPDGLLLQVTTKPEAVGHLLEIKCPKSRKIGVKLPTEYYYQMQIQMEVTGVRACEYVEASFTINETYNTTRWCGIIAVIGCFCEADNTWKSSRYIYGPLNNINWSPSEELGLNERVVEVNTWKCDNYHHETVIRDEAWFSSIRPSIMDFWSDVEKAKNGYFTIPESSRKRKAVVCELIDSEPENTVQPTAEIINAQH